jgi:hypothetical protein
MPERTFSAVVQLRTDMRAIRQLLPTLLGLITLAPVQGQAAPVQAVWKPENITVSYFSPTTYYSCDALEAKMKRIIDQLGLVGDVHVRAADCARGVVATPNIHIEALVPVEATPAALADLKKDETHQALVDRLNKTRARKVEVGAQFPAQWRDVQVGKGLDLTGADCDLLRDLQRQLLPKLAVKIKPSNRTCDSREGPTSVKPFLDLQVLSPVATPDQGA